ncbi:MAG TPA: DUF4142 domain-containing protein [Ohtaekwangia sp.]|uniref:DUF4142 domain-containing protein n=1 Tax=Ohtaekwangia sp. TaxID=2066019 RepID=UPI002F95F21A
MKRIQCKKTMGIALLAIVAWASACDDDDNHKNDLIQQDRDFIAQASYVNRSEVELGTLAVSKGNSDAVRMYGSSMRTEHQPALDKLKGIASDLGADFPTGLDAENQAIKDKLMSLSGYAFDTAYIHSQIKGHQKAEALFQAEANNGKGVAPEGLCERLAASHTHTFANGRQYSCNTGNTGAGKGYEQLGIAAGYWPQAAWMYLTHARRCM